MRRFLLVFASLSAAATLVFAAGPSATLVFTLASQYVDASPLPVADIKETLIEWRKPGQTALVGSAHVAAPAVQTTVAGLTCGDFDFVAYTVLKAGPNSDATAPVRYQTGVVCKPNPPGGLAAQ